MKNFKRRDKNAKEPSMKIYVRNNDINGAIRILKKKLMKEGLFQELRERTHHTTRGEKRRRAKAAGTRRFQRKMEKRRQELGY
tara:strand:- start:3038 stop:3286 length:249 start_codon:yes stop_codon:yes gene_type:complete